MTALVLAVVAALVVAIPADARPVTPTDFEPPVAVDVDPDPDTVHVRLTASEDRVRFRAGGPLTTVWAMNGSVPAPTIEAEVGDRLVAEFCNELPAEAGASTIHWHGPEVEAEDDGSPLSDLTVPVGSCVTYAFDLLRAATYWYHSHVDSNVQIEKGLHGTLVVRDPAEDAALGLPDDHVLVLDDVLLGDDGQIAPELPDDPLARAKMLLDGREGNTLLVNGRADRTVNVQRGEPIRLRLVNVSNSRFMRVSVPGHTIWRIGGDAGLIHGPEAIEPIGMVEAEDGTTMSDPDLDKGLMLVPGERAEVVLTPMGAAGDTVALEWHDHARGRHAPFHRPDGSIGIEDDPADGRAPVQTLMTFRLVGKPGAGGWSPPATLRPVEAVDATGAAPIPVVFGHGPPTATGDVTFFAQRVGMMPVPNDRVTPAVAPDAVVGETRVWEITNLTGADHPFHAHGFFFQPLEVQYIDMDDPTNNVTVPFQQAEWKDSVRVPARPGAMMRSRTVLRAVVVFDDTGREGEVASFGGRERVASGAGPGGWMFHCHINEHSAYGMMSYLELREP